MEIKYIILSSALFVLVGYKCFVHLRVLIEEHQKLFSILNECKSDIKKAEKTNSNRTSSQISQLQKLQKKDKLSIEYEKSILDIKDIIDELFRITKKMEHIESNESVRVEILEIISKTVKSELWLDRFKQHVNDCFPSFFKKLSQLSSNLTDRELLHCAFTIFNLSVKETSLILGSSGKSTEMARYRIRRKLSLSKEVSLYKFLLSTFSEDTKSRLQEEFANQ